METSQIWVWGYMLGLRPNFYDLIPPPIFATPSDNLFCLSLPTASELCRASQNAAGHALHFGVAAKAIHGLMIFDH